MAEQVPGNKQTSDEIDLGQLFQMIRKGFKSLFHSFLRLFVYLKKNIIVLVGLVVLGVGIGLALNLVFEKKLMTEVIIKPNFDSKDYLYDVVNELQSNIRTRDSIFFTGIGIETSDLDGFDISVEPVQESETENNAEDDLKYLALLQNFKDEPFAVDVIRSELFKKSIVNHRLKFTFKNAEIGQGNITKILAYLNSNGHFQALGKVYQENVASRIQKNTELIAQIDELVAEYAKGLSQKRQRPSDSPVYLESENALDIPNLLTLKNTLIAEIEDKKIDLLTSKQVITVINQGNAQIVKKQFFNKSIVLIPTVLLGIFFLVALIRYLNRKATDLNV